jgi:hypothetical protein
MADQGFLADNMKGFLNMTFLKQYGFTILLIFVLPLSGCAGSTTFKVLDAKTKQPIEGAVALAEWTSTGGLPGLSHTSIAKVAEDVSDSEGKLTIPGAWGFLALQTPHIKIYKAGYVGWDSKLIYLGYYKNDIKAGNLVKRTDFSMKNQDIRDVQLSRNAVPMRYPAKQAAISPTDSSVKSTLPLRKLHIA